MNGLVVAAVLVLAAGGLGLVDYVHTHLHPRKEHAVRHLASRRSVPSKPPINLPPQHCRPYIFGHEADDTQEVQSFVNSAVDARRSHESVCIAPNLNLLVSSTIVVNGPAFLNFRGARISKASSLGGFVLAVNSQDVTVTNLGVEGDHNGGGGIQWQGQDGQASNVHVVDTDTNGFQVDGSDSSVLIDDSSSDDNVTPDVPHDGYGFVAQDGGRLITNDTSATHNGYAGYFLNDAGRGSQISGSSAHNYFAGLEVRGTQDLSIVDFTTNADWHYGVYLADVVDCSIGLVRAYDTGQAQDGLPANGFGASVEFLAAQGCTARTIDVRNTPGYGVALSEGDNQGSFDNFFQEINVTRTGNPGIELYGSSSDNTFVNSVLTDVTVGVAMGGGNIYLAPERSIQQNDNNVFDRVSLDDNRWAAISIDSGSNNTFKLVNATDTMGRYPDASGNAVVRFIGGNNAAYGNVVNELNISTDKAIYLEPQYIVYANDLAVGNRVRIATLQGGYSVAPWPDAAGTNVFSGP